MHIRHSWSTATITRDIFQVALARLRKNTGVVERYRLLHNLLSSQPLCFNLFDPLHLDPARATRLLGAFPELGISRVHAVELEYAPQPVSEYLGDRTAFDVYLLTMALRDHGASPYERGMLMLVRHPGDTACAMVVHGHQPLLWSQSTFLDMPLDRLVAAWQAVSTDEERRGWLHAFEQRYLDLGASEDAG